MVIARTLLKLWSSELDQIDPYNVPELFRGVPRPKTDLKKHVFFPKNDSPKRKTQKSGKKKAPAADSQGGDSSLL